MKRLVPALLIAAVVAGAAGAAEPNRVLAIEWEAGGGKLRWVSATTLRPAGPRSLNVGGAPFGLRAVSPDGRQAVLGGGTGGRLRLVELGTLRGTGLLRLGGYSVSGALWPARDRVVVLSSGREAEVVVVDPLTRRVLSRTPLPGASGGVVKAGGRLVILLTPPETIGQAHLAIVTAHGSVRTVALPGVQAGFAPSRELDGTGRQASPGLAVSGDGRRAAVAEPDRITLIDLDTLETEVQRFATRSTARIGKRIEGWGRGAIWVSDDRVAVSGWNDAWEGDRALRTKTGVRIVNVKSGDSTLLDETALRAELVDDTLLAYGGSALRGYRLDGTLRFQLLDGQDTGYIQTAGDYAYVGSGNSTRFVVVDVRAGRVVGKAQTHKPTVVLGP